MNPIATRPARPAQEPPYRPDVACASQKVPNLIARTGGAETQVGTDNGSATARSASSTSTATSGVGERLASALTPAPPGAKTTTTSGGGAGK